MSTPISNKESCTDQLARVDSNSVGDAQPINELRREFKPRHIYMFSVASAIGTGLIIGSGTALSRGGPASLLIAYVLVGLAVFFVMTALGEMAAFLPMNKGFGGYATRMVDPAFGYATGWNYFFKYIIATPTNLTAAGLIIQYWKPDLNVAIWVCVFGVAVIMINSVHIKHLGETEFWLGLIKVVVMTTLIITCFVISMGGSPSHDRIGFRYWSIPGAFSEFLLQGPRGYFLGWWACMCQATFGYAGTEVVGMTFGEIPNPRKMVPRAVKQTFWRIACFYVLGVLVLGMSVPYTSERLVGATKVSTSAAASPFVLAITSASIKGLPDVINAALLVFVLSAANSDIYCASRSLYGLAKDHQAPRIFQKTLSTDNPIVAVLFVSLFVALGFLNAAKSSSVVFGYFMSLVTIFALLNWIAILVSYLSFQRGLKAQGILPQTLPYTGWLQPYGSYYALLFSLAVLFFSGYDAFIPHFKIETFILKYIGIILFVFNVAFWKIFKSTARVRASNMDLTSGRRDSGEPEAFED